MNPKQWPVWYDQRDQRSQADTRSFASYPGPGPGGFPGGSFPQFPPQPQAFTPQQMPFSAGPPGLPAAPTAAGGGGGLSGLLNGFNLGQVKNIVDRMGGIDGIVSTVGKFQKIFGQIQQMQPMLKLLLNMVPGKSKSSGSSSAGEEKEWQPRPRRRKRRRRRRKGKASVRSAAYPRNPRRRSTW